MTRPRVLNVVGLSPYCCFYQSNDQIGITAQLLAFNRPLSVKRIAAMARTDIEFSTFDGVTLRGWFYTPAQSSSKKLATIIMSHGLSCVKEMGLDDVAAKYVVELPVNVLVYDHRGFGASDTAAYAPRQEVNTYLQASDMRDAITYAQMREDVDKTKLALWGFSLSSAVSLYVAAIDRRVKAVVALGPGLDGGEVVKRLSTPHAINDIQNLFEADRLARAQGRRPTKLPIVSLDPTTPSTLPSPESFLFFSEWEREGSSWKNEVTIRR